MTLNLTREDILRAIKEIDNNPSRRTGRNSSTYDLMYEGQKYPPILVLSVASELKGGQPVTLSDYKNNVEVPFGILKEKGYDIKLKANADEAHGFYDQLLLFLEQAKTDNLKTKQYLKEYAGTKVKVSFGQGTTARVPWISFLLPPHTTSSGIYPVYLYYKSLDLLILAYGVSETNSPDIHWNEIVSEGTIKEYLEQQVGQTPEKYGSSYVFKAYDANDLPSEQVINNDLNNLITQYKQQFSEAIAAESQTQIAFSATAFQIDLIQAGLNYSSQLVTRFIASLLTKPFLILTGLSGSGKTKLAQAFAQWICEDSNQYRIVPVGADWTNREPLLGYPNALNPEEYVQPDSGVLELILRANENSHQPHFLILDEMNLSHVERYFADFLSVMESQQPIALHSSATIKGVPPQLSLPRNLFLIGTVNIDETTNMFSPKVLDRANTIEFRISANEMVNYLAEPKPLNMTRLTAQGTDMAQDFLRLSQQSAGIVEAADHTILLEFFTTLQKAGAEFGYRTAGEIQRLSQQLTQLAPDMPDDEKMDIAVMQKLLPKLHGSRRKLVPVLTKLATLCVNTPLDVQKDIFDQEDFDFNEERVRYPLSLEKIVRMYKGAVDNGFASFAEA